jgi:hypothetical protein
MRSHAILPFALFADGLALAAPALAGPQSLPGDTLPPFGMLDTNGRPPPPPTLPPGKA